MKVRTSIAIVSAYPEPLEDFPELRALGLKIGHCEVKEAGIFPSNNIDTREWYYGEKGNL